jgi:hypothetical protein
MYEVAPDGRHVLSRTWMIFFERLKSVEEGDVIAGKGVFTRTLLLKNTIVGQDIADRTTVYENGYAVKITGVLRKPITVDLRVVLRLNTIPIIELRIPASTPVNTVIESSAFNVVNLPPPHVFTEGDLFTWDVEESDASKDINGVASFTIEWASTPAVAAARRKRRI